MKHTIKSACIVIITFCTMSAMTVTALASEPIQERNEIVIDLNTEADWQQMRQQDLVEYNAKINGIDKPLADKVNAFLDTHEELLPIQSRNSTPVASNDVFLAEFIATYPEYAGMENQIADDVELLRANIVVGAVRAFFSANGYDLALDLFNHSLTDNPATASLTLTGNTGGMYSHIRSELSNDPFLSKMTSFANKSGTESITDSSYTFDNGDLYWAIHGFTWTRTRTSARTASFAIDDVYDFNKWQDIPGIVAGLAGTHEFDIHIGGLVKNGVIQ